jgi:RNA polymerase sigma factor (sigma-70 family)
MNAAMQAMPAQRPRGPAPDEAEWDDAARWDDADEVAANDAEEPIDGVGLGVEIAVGPMRCSDIGGAADDQRLAEWIERIAARDARALEALYEAAGHRIHGVVHRFTRRQALTEEVVEDTFWQVWRQAPRFDAQRGRAMTWLLAMARSRAIDALRREQRFQHEPLPGDDGAEDAECAHDGEAHDLLDATHGAARLHAAVATLEPRARQLVALAFFRGLTHEEIAVHATLPLGTVKSVIRRALLQLRECMQPRSASSGSEP